MKWKPVIAVDFDGVLHDYDGVWAPGLVRGEAIDGAMEFLHRVFVEGSYDIAIHSTRSRYLNGRSAMKRWINKKLTTKYNPYVARDISKWLKWPWTKPGAIVYIDDRAIRFTGHFPSVRDVREFRTWNRPVTPSDVPSLDDPNWNRDVMGELYKLSTENPQRKFWVIWNSGGGRRVVGRLTRPLSMHDDIEAWQPIKELP